MQKLAFRNGAQGATSKFTRTSIVEDKTLVESSTEKKPSVGPSQKTPPGIDQRSIASAGISKRSPSEQSADAAGLRLIDLELIDIETQVRTRFNEHYIADLALDFLHSGLLQPKQPITVYQRSNGRYLLDSGENRVRAMRYGAAHLDAWNINDKSAFSHIRAIVLGAEPDKLGRLQSQARENLLRDDLNDIDLAHAVKLYLDSTPGATHSDAANWVGFVNLKSGRVRVHNALRLLKCDDDLINDVKAGKLAASRALQLHIQRQTLSSSAIASKSLPAKNADKAVTLSLPMDALLCASEILLIVAKTKGIELLSTTSRLDRHSIDKVFNAAALAMLLDSIRQ